MNGGKLVGQGSFGCVFNEPLLCENENVRKHGQVSKLLANVDAKAEISENNKISKIDPGYKWHLKSYKSCKPKLPTESDGVNKCNIIPDGVQRKMSEQWKTDGTDNSMLKKYTNILQDDGGTSVSDYIANKPSSFSKQSSKNKAFIDLFIQSENLLLGIKELYEKNMCHFDIKTDNVVYNESKKRFNFIDFGLTRKIDKVKSFEALQRAYWVWPLDLWFCHTDSKTQYFDNSRALGWYGPKPPMYRYESSYAKTVVESNIGIGNIYTDCLDTVEKIDSYKEYIKKEGYSTFRRRISESIDTFSLGILYMQMWVSFTGTRFDVGVCNLNSKLEHYNELKSIHDFINLMLVSNSLHRMRAPQIYEYYINNVKPILSGVIPKKKGIAPKILLNSPNILPSGEIVQSKKVCPDGQILNPRTRRCVSLTGAIGKKLRTQRERHSAMINLSSSRKNINKTKKICPPGKILNPGTNRCVALTGAIGKKLATKKNTPRR
jgi:serine/threonine protein kinase